MFTTPIGTPVDPRNDYREFKKLLGKAGLPPVRLHDLRHTAASLLIGWWRAWGSNPEPTD